jgi:hypothetical protein
MNTPEFAAFLRQQKERARNKTGKRGVSRETRREIELGLGLVGEDDGGCEAAVPLDSRGPEPQQTAPPSSSVKVSQAQSSLVKVSQTSKSVPSDNASITSTDSQALKLSGEVIYSPAPND